MSNELTFNLQDIIKRAASTTVEGPAAKMRKRFTDATNEVVVLCDCSGSMCDAIGSLHMSKFEHLQIALKDVLHGFPRIRLIAFGSTTMECPTPSHLPSPMSGGLGGSTNLAAGLMLAAKYKPRKTIVISDGLPDSESAATEAVQHLTGSVDTIYCGPDGHPAVAFLASLARSTGGRQATWDGYREISSVIFGLLPAPAGPIVTPAPE
jgi:hypothetical protein